jgi:hypothetical protein
MKRVKNIFCVVVLCFCSLVARGYSVFEDNGKVGLKNEAGKVLIPAKYEALGWSDGKFSIMSNATGYRTGGKWGLINISNQLITKPEFEEISPADATLLFARKRSPSSLRVVSGVINAAGKEIIPFQYDDIRLSSLRAIVFSKVGDQYKYGLIDLENRMLIPQTFKNIKSVGSLRYAAENFEGKWALFTDIGKQLTNFDTDSMSHFKKDYAIIYQSGRQGLIDRNGVTKIAAQSQEIQINGDGKVSTRQTATWFFLSGENKLHQKVSADSVGEISKNLLAIRNSGAIQLIDYTLKPVSTIRMHSLESFRNGTAIFCTDGKCGVIRSDGKVIIPPNYSALKRDGHYYPSHQKLAGKDGWILLDSTGKSLHSKMYDAILPFNGSFFPVISRNFWGAINREGQQILSCTYDSILQQRADKIVVKFHGQYGIINQREHWLITPRPNKIILIADDRFLEFGAPTVYLKSMDNNIVYFSENRLEVRGERLLEYLPSGTIWEIGMNGVILDRKLLPDRVEKIYPESEGLRGIKKNGQFGFIDSQGRLRIANRYDDIQPFSDGYAAMKIRGKWGFIGHDDKIAIQPIFDEVTNFKNGLSVVKQKGLFGVAATSGKLVLFPRYQSIEILPHRNILIRQDNLVGLADPQGKILINPKYNQLRDLNNGYIIVERNGKYGAISLKGISTIPLIYDYISYDAYNDVFFGKVNAQWSEVKL